MPETLKPCPVPWCGGGTLRMDSGSTQARVRCSGCGLDSPWCPTEAEAAKLWNTRPADAVREAAQKVAEARTRMLQVPSGEANLSVQALIVLNASMDALSALLKESPQ